MLIDIGGTKAHPTSGEMVFWSFYAKEREAGHIS